MMRIALLTALALCVCVASGQSQPYVIDSFDVRIELHQDATIDVSESIKVRFNQPRHGIFRFIPVGWRERRGVRVRRGRVLRRRFRGRRGRELVGRFRIDD